MESRVVLKVLMYTDITVPCGVTTFQTQIEKGRDIFSDKGIDFEFCTHISNPIKKMFPSETVFLSLYSNELVYRQTSENAIIRKLIHAPQKIFWYMKKPFVYLINLRRFYRLISRKNFDCVIGNSGGYVFSNALDVLIAAKRGHIPLRVFLSHNYPEKRKTIKDKIFGALLDCTIKHYCTHFITVSNYSAAQINRVRVRRNPDIDVIYNGLDKEKSLRSLSEKKELLLNGWEREDYYYIGMIANFARYKGQLYFLEILKRVNKKFNNVKGIIIGGIYDEDYYEKCMETIRQCNLGDNILIRTDINDAADYVEVFNILLMPSISTESFGLVALESMQYGVPVIAFDTGGIPEVVKNGYSGDIVERGNIDKAVKKVEELIINPDKYYRYSQGALEQSEKFTGRRMCKEYARYLYNIR